MQLLGTEIKSIRQGKASIAEAYCYMKDGEMWVKNMNIAEYDFGNGPKVFIDNFGTNAGLINYFKEYLEA